MVYVKVKQERGQWTSLLGILSQGKKVCESAGQGSCYPDWKAGMPFPQNPQEFSIDICISKFHSTICISKFHSTSGMVDESKVEVISTKATVLKRYPINWLVGNLWELVNHPLYGWRWQCFVSMGEKGGRAGMTNCWGKSSQGWAPPLWV